jgi:undecaprenyl diphosphate synthase
MPERRQPRHIAFIMDGNGRWARSRGFLRLRGHKEGAESLRRITRFAARAGIPEVTFFALSTENYRRRPREEVSYLMGLLIDYLIGEREELAENNIRLVAIGRVEELPAEVQRELDITVRGSAHHTGMVLRLALNYGSRQEIADAALRLAEEVQAGRLQPSEIDEEALRRFLYDPAMPDPDLLVRTAGEFRLSNFFLWQASYTEVWVADVLWPEFDVKHLEAALAAYGRRDRKFGGVEPVPASTPLGGGAGAGAGGRL